MEMPDGYINVLHSIDKGTGVRVEQRELVQCRHCKHFDPERVEFCGMGVCKLYDAMKPPAGFCDEGNRRAKNHENVG